MAKRKQFTFYESFYRALAKLPIEEAQQGLWAIVTYGILGTLPDDQIAPAADAIFEMAKPVLDSARSKAEAIIASNKRRAKNVDSSQSVSNVTPITTQEKEKEKEVEKEIEKEVEKEVEIEKEIEKESLYTDGVCVLGDTDTDRFERFWSFYPNKLGKQKAWEAWQMVLPDLDQVMVALERWKRSRQWMQDSGRYIPKAENFLEEKYYEQPPKDAVPMGASGYLGKAELEAIERLMNESD